MSRVGYLFEEQGVEASGQELFISDTFCERAARRVNARFDQLEKNDDERMESIAKLTYKRGSYGYALFED
jgi:acyl-CoA dehydrogenase family protein 9